MNSENKITDFVKKEFNNDLKHLTMVRESNNSFLLFNRYRLYKKNNQVNIEHLRITEFHTFFRAKNAVTWCIFENFNQYYDANRIKNLDRIFADQELQIDLYKKLVYKENDKDQKIIYYNKLTEGLAKKKAVAFEIEKFINTSRTLLNKKFHLGLN